MTREGRRRHDPLPGRRRCTPSEDAKTRTARRNRLHRVRGGAGAHPSSRHGGRGSWRSPRTAAVSYDRRTRTTQPGPPIPHLPVTPITCRPRWRDQRVPTSRINADYTVGDEVVAPTGFRPGLGSRAASPRPVTHASSTGGTTTRVKIKYGAQPLATSGRSAPAARSFDACGGGWTARPRRSSGPVRHARPGRGAAEQPWCSTQPGPRGG